VEAQTKEMSQAMDELTKPYLGGVGKSSNPSWQPFVKCTTMNKFGYMDGTPCIGVRINRLIGYEPANISKEQCTEHFVSVHCLQCS
jgi:hypothetical protein